MNRDYNADNTQPVSPTSSTPLNSSSINRDNRTSDPPPPNASYSAQDTSRLNFQGGPASPSQPLAAALSQAINDVGDALTPLSQRALAKASEVIDASRAAAKQAEPHVREALTIGNDAARKAGTKAIEISGAVGSGTLKAAKHVSWWAIFAFLFAILALIPLSVTAIPAIAFGHTALSQIKRNPRQLTGRGFALIGLYTGYLSLAISLIIIVSTIIFEGGSWVGLAASVLSIIHDILTIIEHFLSK